MQSLQTRRAGLRLLLNGHRWRALSQRCAGLCSYPCGWCRCHGGWGRSRWNRMDGPFCRIGI